MKHRYKVEKKPHTGKFVTIVLLVIAISVGSIFSVMANTLEYLVIDGNDVYKFSLLSANSVNIIEEAVEQGMEDLEEDDTFTKEGVTLTVMRAVDISVDDGTGITFLKAYEGEVLGDILARENFVISDDDIVSESLDLVVDADIDININYCLNGTIILNGETNQVSTYSTVVEDILLEQNIDIINGDIISQSLESLVTDGFEITLETQNSITLKYQNETISYDSFATTVGDFLEEQSIVLDEDDEVVPSLDFEITTNLTINIGIVEYVDVVETESVSYSTVKTYSDDMYEGESKITTIGQNGEKEITYTEKYIDGQLVETSQTTETVVIDPISKVIVYGTKEVKEDSTTDTSTDNTTDSTTDTSTDSSSSSSSSLTFVDYNGDTVSYSSVITGECTAYTATGNTTSLGGVAQVGVVAVDPSIIPYGTKMYITSGSVVYGYAVAGDTGGALLAGNALIDLYYDTEQECISFGRRDMTIYFLD